MTKLGIGIIGCGNISSAYAKLIPLFGTIRLCACADANHTAAEELAAKHDLQALSVDDLLASAEVDIVLNLTVPKAHAAITLQALAAGKHVYSEKPLALSMKEGNQIAQQAEKAGLKVGGAADTFLGGGHQLARSLIDDGKLGKVHSGSCHVLLPGMESWHPNPDFFFQPGGGPVFDMGSYYIGNLLNLIGPVVRVAAFSCTPRRERVIGSGPRAGEAVPVDVPTSYHCLLELEGDVVASYTTSWDVHGHRHPYMEIYGTDAALFVPDPNFFGGDVTLVEPGNKEHIVPAWDHPFTPANFDHGQDQRSANYRGAGLADMARAIIQGGEHRCSLERCLHVVNVMTGLIEAANTKSVVAIDTQCTRPEALDPAQAQALLDR